MTTEAPTRCCAPAASGRCANAPAPHGQSRYIGPVEVAACNLPKHQAALRSLPGFTRREGYCGADGCCKVAQSGLCIEHHNLYRRHGVLPRLLLATMPEVPMSATTPLPAPEDPPKPITPAWAGMDDFGGSDDPRDLLRSPTPEVINAVGSVPPPVPKEPAGEGATPAELLASPLVGAIKAGEQPAGWAAMVEELGCEPVGAYPLEARRDALIARLLAAGFVETQGPSLHLRKFVCYAHTALIPDGHPCEVEEDFRDALDYAEKALAAWTHEMATRQAAVVSRLLALGFTETPSDTATVRRFDRRCDFCVVPTDAYNAEYVERAMKSVEQACDKMEAAKQERQGDAVEPTAPGPTLAEVQADLETCMGNIRAANLLMQAAGCGTALSMPERVRLLIADRDRERVQANEALSQLHDAQRDLKAITAALDADSERSPAWDDNDQPIPLVRRVEIALMPGESQIVADLRASFRGIEQQLGDVDAALHALGAYGLGSTKERLLQVLPVDDRRALLELDAAGLRASLARLNARRINPPTPEKLAEHQRKLDIVEAKLCSLDCDHSPDAGNMLG